MNDRSAAIDRFLAGTEWADATRGALAGDASMRHYERLFRTDGRTAVLMDAPPSGGEDVQTFVQIAGHLHKLGLTAPKILAEDIAAGLLLLEDLGDALFARVLEHAPHKEKKLYLAATNCLLHLQRQVPPMGLVNYDAKLMADLTLVAWEWYAGKAPTEKTRKSLHQCFNGLSEAPNVMILRDFHAENLIWLPKKTGVRQVGLLDFQDALAGHRAYDLASLLADARRDVDPDVRDAVMGHYGKHARVDRDTLEKDTAILGVQRNLRILGVFARLALRDGKPSYVDLVPRVWRHLQRDLGHPALEQVAVFVQADLPNPTEDLLLSFKKASKTSPPL